MNTKEILKAIEKWAAQFEADIDKLEKGLTGRVEKLQTELLKQLAAILEWLEFDGKRLKNSPKNMAKLRRLEGVWSKFERELMDKELALFAEELLKVGQLTIGYYEATGLIKSDAVKRVVETLREVIGIDVDGKLLAGGYLDRLGKTAEVRQQLRDYVLQSIVSKRSLGDFRNGLGDLVVGNDATDGALQRFWRQYAFDTYNQVHEVANKTIADGLGLKYFIYQGSVIENTRQFCRVKAGKVFSTEEAERWKDDPDLIDKKTKAQYNPLLERGRYNCRHFLNYISESVAVELRPDLKK